MADKLTVYQKLTKIFGTGSEPQRSKSSFSVNDKELIKVRSPEEYNFEKLQSQQSKYLKNMWQMVDSEMYQQALYNETTRLASYADFESMEYFPEISAALDIMMEEATTLNEKGEVLNIYSDSKRVKVILEDLFFNRLDLYTNLPPWTRNTCKYGDNMVYLKVGDQKEGIIGVTQLPNIEMERRETDLADFIQSKHVTGSGVKYKKNLKFVWRGKNYEFNSWEVAHFRLLGDDRRLPYGTSVLEKTRRIWKQLLLAEDAMLVYRVSRAPERRIFKIFVGNMTDEDVEPYVQKIANKFKRNIITDPRTGQMDVRYNQLAVDQDFFIPVRSDSPGTIIDTLPGGSNLCLSLDTRIPLLDGRTLKLSEIIDEFKTNKNLWVYSCNPKTGAFAPGIISWAGVTRKNAEVMKITLDNGKELIVTPDHKMLTRDGEFKEAKKLEIGESLMPFYQNEDYVIKKHKNSRKYEKLWQNDKKEWEFTHRIVFNYMKENGIKDEFVYNNQYIDEDKKSIHHKNINHRDNNPFNLCLMNSRDHYLYHQSLMKKWAQNPDNLKYRGQRVSEAKSTLKFKEKFSKIASKQWLNEEYRNKVFSKSQKIIFSDKLYSIFFESFKRNGRADLTLNELNSNFEFMTEFNLSNSDIRSSITNLSEFTHNHIDKMVKDRGFKNYRDWCKKTAESLGYKNVRAWRYYIQKEQGFGPYYETIEKLNNKKILYNHKVVKIEILENRIDTGTITVDGEHKYHNYHTFAVESGVYIRNSEIADIEYLQNKLFAALRVPKPFLGFDATAGEGKNLALQDIRFARTVNRIQQSMIQELNKIAIIHLFLLGFEDELNNFELSLNNPSTQADMMKIEAWREKINLYRDAVADPGNGFQVTSMTWAKQHLLGMSNDEIKLDLEQQKIEKVAAQELAKIGGLKTGLFDHIDRIYKSSDEDAVKDDDAQKQEPGMGGGGGGGFGGGGLGGDLGGDLGAEGELGGEPGAEGELGGDTGVGVPGEGDTGTENPENDQEDNNVPEAIRSSNKPLITEDVKNLIDDIHIDFDKILKNKKS